MDREPTTVSDENTATSSPLLADYDHESALADTLNVTVSTLRTWASRREGPPGRVKIGRSVYYRRSAVQAWLRDREVSFAA